MNARHECPQEMPGDAIHRIVHDEVNGWQAENDEYSGPIRFCPWCGKDLVGSNDFEATVRIFLEINNSSQVIQDLTLSLSQGESYRVVRSLPQQFDTVYQVIGVSCLRIGRRQIANR